ncbi:MAG: DUF1848 domain-containing protein [Desulfobacteraceae bacterium]|nr:DUF1848 domain-containing protein [Desulfobacteraceae bacterium]
MKNAIVLSASRRTDIPAFYMDWFMEGIARQSFAVKNPYNQVVYPVSAGPADVHTIVFWSKDFSLFLDKGCGPRLCKTGYHLFFNFTLNSGSPLLEPGIVPVADRLEQARELCRRFGAQTVVWRFDPVCFFRTAANGAQSNLGDFETIARAMAGFGVRRCVTSFVDLYAKVRRRKPPADGFAWIDPPLEKKVRVVVRMQRLLESLGMSLYLCCEQQILEALPSGTRVFPGACIPNAYLVELFGGRLSFQKDAGQRRKKGCGCMTSRDIGGYADQPCFHNCLYCYANPGTGI